MTDNRTTELLCRLLDERGVEHYDGTESTLWLKDEHGYRASATELSSGRLSVHIWCDTPEQAIAATLGSEREKELVRAMEDVLRHSTDTVWVGEAETLVDRMVSLGVYKHDVYEGGETRYEQLFGTPERAARTLTNICQFAHGGELCDRCQCYLFGDCDKMLRLKSERSIYDAQLEWLRDDAE